MKVQFQSIQTNDFADLLKRRIEQYFESAKISKKANFEMVAKTIFYLSGLVGLYALIVSGLVGVWGALVCAIFLGLFTAGVGFNVSHDAIHGAYSHRPWVNALLGQTFALMGASVFTWKTAHNVIHHSYTNIPEADGDLDAVRLLRFYKRKAPDSLQRYQHWYAFGLYSLTSLVWVFFKDYAHVGRRKHLIYEKPKPPIYEYFILGGSKAAYYFTFLVLPMLITPFTWWQVLIGFLAMHLACGFFLALTFQLGHLVEGPEFPHLPSTGVMPDTRIVHQLKTTANFATEGFVSNWLFGGLNFQIEHHLFPKICHVHYKRLAPIVRATAKEYGLPYHEYRTMLSATLSHLRYLKEAGRTA